VATWLARNRDIGFLDDPVAQFSLLNRSSEKWNDSAARRNFSHPLYLTSQPWLMICRNETNCTPFSGHNIKPDAANCGIIPPNQKPRPSAKPLFRTLVTSVSKQNDRMAKPRTIARKYLNSQRTRRKTGRLPNKNWIANRKSQNNQPKCRTPKQMHTDGQRSLDLSTNS
jgi:hypothetical protein